MCYPRTVTVSISLFMLVYGNTLMDTKEDNSNETLEKF